MPTGEKRRRLIELLRAGKTQVEASREVGCTKQYASMVAAQIGAGRRIDKAIARQVRTETALQLHEMLVSLPPETRQWLREETPKGARMADLIRAIIIDAHAEAQE